MAEHDARLTSGAEFWNARYRAVPAAFGEGVTPVVAEWSPLFAPGARVLDLGAGEARNALFLVRRGVQATALDFARDGLDKAAARAADEGLVLDVEEEDLREWKPEKETWDGLVCVFVHLLPDERETLCRAMRAALAPGGVLIGEWFTPEQADYASGGPSAPDRFVTPEELLGAFEGVGEVLLCESGPRVLDEGPFLQGPAATVRFVFRNMSEAP
ncbi:MAG TPA: class I SAM-dependent methyltransferase [Rhodothermales bacterium]|nr:class I SAM-dependent methyltransferase [Rhodothermales bacterium]